jgi:hypothetical protein
MQNPSPVQKRVVHFREPEQPPENFGSENSPNFPPNFSQPASKGKPEAQPESSGQSQPALPLPPKFTTKLYDKQPQPKKRGRQRAKDRNSHLDGVRQLFELWWHKGGRGVTFGQFYRHQLSEDMRSYYPREYIYGRNPKSAAEYRQWRKAWAARNAVKTA